MASHKTFLYLGVFFILFHMAYYFPEYSISILGALLVIVGYFKIGLYSWITWLLWLAIFCEFILDIGRAGYMGLMYYKANKKVTFRDPIEDENSTIPVDPDVDVI